MNVNRVYTAICLYCTECAMGVILSSQYAIVERQHVSPMHSLTPRDNVKTV